MTSPEQQSSRSHESRASHIEGVPAFLQLEQIDRMRDDQENMVEQMQQLVPGEPLTAEEKDQTIEGVLDGIMARSGLEQDDPHYQTARDFLRDVSIDHINEEDWYTPQYSENGEGEYIPSERESAELFIGQHFAWETTTDSTPPSDVESQDPTDSDAAVEAQPTPTLDEEMQPQPDDAETQPIPQFTPEQEAQLQELERRWNEANDRVDATRRYMSAVRDSYLYRRAGNARRAIHIREDFRNSSVEAARDNYERARTMYEQDLAAVVAIEAEAIRITGEDPYTNMREAVLAEEHQLATSYRDHRLVATGNYEFDPQGNVVEVQRGFVGRAMHKFYKWYGQVNAEGKRLSGGAFKKAGVMALAGAAASVPLGILLAPVAGVAVAGVGAGVIANRIAKAYMSTHVHKRSHDANDQYAEIQHNELLADHQAGGGQVYMADLIDQQAKREVKRNRVRGALIGTTAVAGAFAVWGGEALFHYADNHWFGDTAHAVSQPGDVHLPPAPGNNPVGFTPEVTVESGHGYAKEISDLFEQRGVHLTDAQSMDAYNDLVQKLPQLRGNFFTDDPSYIRSAGDYGISHAGTAHWDPAVLRELDAWGKTQNL